MLNYKHNQTFESLKGLKVYVYFNLHKECLSVKSLSGTCKGLVVLHTNTINLTDVTFKVSEAGRQRVLREQRKNVHAVVVGYIQGFESISSVGYEQAYYNPYRTRTFMSGDNSVCQASSVILKNKLVLFKD